MHFCIVLIIDKVLRSKVFIIHIFRRVNFDLYILLNLQYIGIMFMYYNLII